MTVTISADTDLNLDAKGNLFIVDGVEAIRQAALHHMRYFLGEWYLNPPEGVPYYERILGHLHDPAVLSNVLSAELLKVNGVTRAVVGDIRFNVSTRELERYVAYLDTVEGPITLIIGQ